MKAVVGERGQVTVPKRVRLELGIKPGTVLDFSVKEGVLIAEKEAHVDAFEAVYGCLGKRMKTDEIMHELRGDS